MSYIKIDFGGKERGLKFNQLALEIMADYASATETTSNVYAMFYGGLRGNSYVKREQPDYSFENVCDWVDELYSSKRTDVIKEVENVLVETQLFKSLIPEKKSNKEGEEKKRPLKKIA